VKKRYPLSLDDISRLDHGRRTAAWLLKEGIRQQHGIGPNQPLTPQMRTACERIVKATDRLFALNELAR
jgi:hypothetical protein